MKRPERQTGDLWKEIAIIRRGYTVCLYVCMSVCLFVCLHAWHACIHVCIMYNLYIMSTMCMCKWLGTSSHIKTGAGMVLSPMMLSDSLHPNIFLKGITGFVKTFQTTEPPRTMNTGAQLNHLFLSKLWGHQTGGLFESKKIEGTHPTSIQLPHT